MRGVANVYSCVAGWGTRNCALGVVVDVGRKRGGVRGGMGWVCGELQGQELENVRAVIAYDRGVIGACLLLALLLQVLVAVALALCQATAQEACVQAAQRLPDTAAHARGVRDSVGAGARARGQGSNRPAHCSVWHCMIRRARAVPRYDRVGVVAVADFRVVGLWPHT